MEEQNIKRTKSVTPSLSELAREATCRCPEAKRTTKSGWTRNHGDFLDNERLEAGLEPSAKMWEPLNIFLSVGRRKTSSLCLKLQYRTTVSLEV